ncbi:O-antigen ligase family protein [Butyrivibrio sp. AE2015]|uniref:O-antigen ligase family protein n=1 Tax=Butyrivibrio sp. AE2015 TaxID=1280663 RepID=UPI0003B7B9B2|nr:hypothetical protein [Butyrivibrio sp. AE2015]
MQNQKSSISKANLLGFLLFIIIIIETAFENTELQFYDLRVNRIIFLGEAIIFLLDLAMCKYSKKSLVIIFSLFVAFLGSYFLLGTTVLLKMYILSVVISKCDYTQTFKVLWMIKILALIIVIFSALIGIIGVNSMSVAKGREHFAYGYGLGYTHPNRLGSALLYILMCYLCYRNERLKKHQLCVVVLISIVAFAITKCRTLIFCVALFCVFYYLYKSRYFREIVKRVIRIVGPCSVPICVGMSIGFPFLLMRSSGIVQKVVYFINLMFNRRFTHIEWAFLTYPVTLAGGNYDFSSLEEKFGYAIIDNGYIRFLYNYGILGLTMFALLTTVCLFLLVRRQKYLYVVICTIIAIQGMIENIYVYIGFNILVVFWSELFRNHDRNSSVY